MRVQIGIQLPQWGAAADRAGVLAVAQAAEAAGFDAVWASDHPVYPLDAAAEYPYSSGGPPFTPDDGYLEVLTTLAFVAGATQSIRLGTSVLILPMRNVLLTAKALATLDVLSGGRVVVAVGAGWWQGEFEALGASFRHRGTTLDEQLEALRGLWTRGEYEMRGEQVRFQLVALKPLPVQRDGPEVWVGGDGPRTWARVAGASVAGWHGIGYRPEKIRAAQAAIAAACRVTGRDPATVRFSTATGLPDTKPKFFERLELLHNLGISQVVLIPHDASVASILEAIRLYGEEVRPHLQGPLGAPPI